MNIEVTRGGEETLQKPVFHRQRHLSGRAGKKATCGGDNMHLNDTQRVLNHIPHLVLYERNVCTCAFAQMNVINKAIHRIIPNSTAPSEQQLCPVHAGKRLRSDSSTTYCQPKQKKSHWTNCGGTRNSSKSSMEVCCNEVSCAIT